MPATSVPWRQPPSLAATSVPVRNLRPWPRHLAGRVECVAMRYVLSLLLILALPANALATWSVIAVDRSTGRVVIASATCVDRDDQFLMGVQAVVVPGKGVAACQAGVDGTHKNQ